MSRTADAIGFILGGLILLFLPLVMLAIVLQTLATYIWQNMWHKIRGK